MMEISETNPARSIAEIENLRDGYRMQRISRRTYLIDRVHRGVDVSKLAFQKLGDDASH